MNLAQVKRMGLKRTRALLRNHWVHILTNLQHCNALAPVLLSDEDSVVRGRDWAAAFMLGVGLRPDGWDALVDSDEYGDWVLPIQCLAYQERLLEEGKALTAPERELLLQGIPVAGRRLYEYFHTH